jgi:prepilin-type processing-associated H-X9-DG protein
MKHNVIRYSIIILAIGLVALDASRANAQGRHRNEIHIESLSWGLSSGQTARVSVANFVFLDGSVRSVPVRIQLLDMEGDVIAQSDEMRVEPGQTRFFDAPRELLPAGEPTGRLQLRARILIMAENARRLPPVAPSVEIFDSGTGRTVMIFDSFLKLEGIPGEAP